MMPYAPERRAFVHANSRLAEHLCGLHVTDLTVARARRLQKIHGEHHPDDCLIHLAAAAMLLEYRSR
ncbi:hypothetical protein OG225_13635 [Nocardia sp. NBC_01377]|uniref:hypothetical protein n=1 Tax=Nocardia sp. NBC_01377 TaxID=2903595 RepID=UPI003246CBE8